MDQALTSLRTRSIASAIWLILILAALPASPAELLATYANDPVAGNPRPDDLYTSDVELTVVTDRYRIVAGERMFTDREVGHRLDETHLSVVRPLGTIRGWDTEISVGLLRAGEGFLGESIQNSLHQAIGSDEVDLPYIPADTIHGTAGVTLTRELGSLGAIGLRSDLEAYVAHEFRSWIRANVAAGRPLAGSAWIELALGARVDEAESEWLSPSIGGASPTAHLALAWRSTEIRWTWNEYGTRSPHLFIGFRAPIVVRGNRAH